MENDIEELAIRMELAVGHMQDAMAQIMEYEKNLKLPVNASIRTKQQIIFLTELSGMSWQTLNSIKQDIKAIRTAHA